MKVLNSWNCIFINIFFLKFIFSDGNGESKQTVYNKCTEVKNSIGSADIIFFSVGFGSDADSECLNQMCKIFNNHNLVLDGRFLFLNIQLI